MTTRQKRTATAPQLRLSLLLVGQESNTNDRFRIYPQHLPRNQVPRAHVKACREVAEDVRALSTLRFSLDV